MKHKTYSKGFTLIELIITISILAVLVAIVVVALNPAEQLKRSRDTKRVSDLDSMKTAWNLYLAQATGTANLDGGSTANNTCVGGAGSDTLFTNTTGALGTIGGTFAATSTSIGQLVATTTPALTATSWAPAVLAFTPGGAPVAQLPLDPTNGAGNGTAYYYAYACRTTGVFEFTARLESDYFLTSLDMDGTDGGNSSSTYEAGTDLSIIPNAF